MYFLSCEITLCILEGFTSLKVVLDRAYIIRTSNAPNFDKSNFELSKPFCSNKKSNLKPSELCQKWLIFEQY